MGYLGCFQLLDITDKTIMNIVEDVSIYGGASFGYMSKSDIGGFSGRSIFIFLGKLKIDFQSSCTSWKRRRKVAP